MWSFYRRLIGAWATGAVVGGVVAGVIASAVIVLLLEGMVAGVWAWLAMLLAGFSALGVLLGTPLVLLWNNWDDPLSGNTHEEYAKGLFASNDAGRKLIEGGLAVGIILVAYAGGLVVTFLIGRGAYEMVERAQVERHASIEAEIRDAEREVIALARFTCPSLSEERILTERDGAAETRNRRRELGIMRSDATGSRQSADGERELSARQIRQRIQRMEDEENLR